MKEKISKPKLTVIEGGKKGKDNNDNGKIPTEEVLRKEIEYMGSHIDSDTFIFKDEKDAEDTDTDKES